MIHLKLTRAVYSAAVSDLHAPHRFCAERIGFIFVRKGTSEGGDLLLLGSRYVRTADDNYVDDPGVGARIDSAAIRGVMQALLDSQQGGLHVHLHSHRGRPRFSATDTRELNKLIPCFQNVATGAVHGAVVLSEDSLSVRLLQPSSPWTTRGIKVSIIGNPTVVYEQK